MRAAQILVLFSALTGCASGSAPLDAAKARALYVEAVDRRLGGDARGAQDLLIEVAHRAPDTRAGIKARAMLTSGDQLFGTMSTLGVLAGIAIPNFIRYQTRAKQTVARTEAERLRLVFDDHRQRTGSFVGASETLNPPGEPYALLLGENKVLPQGPRGQALLERARPIWQRTKSTPFVGKKAFRIFLAGDIDDDLGIDLWMLDSESADVVHLEDDLD